MVIVKMLAIPKILRGRNTLCAAETGANYIPINCTCWRCEYISYVAGSGKTLAYLAPLISRLKDEEEHHGVVARLKRPRALIVLPSRDLAAQVLVRKFTAQIFFISFVLLSYVVHFPVGYQVFMSRGKV